MRLFGAAINLYLFAILCMVVLLSHKPAQQEHKQPAHIALRAEHENLPPPDFANIQDTQQKKAAFFNYFTPIIEHENNHILKLRKTLTDIEQEFTTSAKFSPASLELLDTYSRFYGVEVEQMPEQKLQALLLRVNIVPVSLALAQAANESAWGTSRFAREGNNYFGQWCFTKGCGLVPEHRAAGARHEVRVFASSADSVSAYIYNINTHSAYKKLRAMRASDTAEQRPLTGMALANGLAQYSERGAAYVAEIKNMIRDNFLEKTDTEQIGTR